MAAKRGLGSSKSTPPIGDKNVLRKQKYSTITMSCKIQTVLVYKLAEDADIFRA